MGRIKLTRGMEAIVDDADLPLLMQFRWCAHFDRVRGIYYAVTHIGPRKAHIAGFTGNHVPMHRLLLVLRPDQEGDHINRDTLDNRRCNLRAATSQQNSCNRGKRRGAALPIKGAFINSHGRYTVRICVAVGRRKSVGTFGNLKEAADAYDAAARQHYGEFASLNNYQEATNV